MIFNKFGICQGRLTEPPNNQLQWFPGDKWSKEFSIGAKIGYSYIELLVERNHNLDNPIWQESGRKEILNSSKDSKINIYSACLDYIIDHSFSKKDELDITIVDYTKNFIDCCEDIGIELIVLPFLEKSSLCKPNINLVKEFLELIGSYAFYKGIKVSIESIANPGLISEVLEDFQKYEIGCVFDTGNRALICKNLNEEVRSLSKYINHIHLKDRDNNNNNVIIGTGIVDFLSVFECLKEISYGGRYSFESNRGRNALNTAIHNLNFMKFIIEEVGIE